MVSEFLSISYEKMDGTLFHAERFVSMSDPCVTDSVGFTASFVHIRTVLSISFVFSLGTLTLEISSPVCTSNA